MQFQLHKLPSSPSPLFCKLNHRRGSQHTVVERPFFLLVYIAPLMPQMLDDPSNNNWHRLWESNKKSHQRCARAWLQRISSNPSPLIAPTAPLSTSDSSDTVAMKSNPMIQSPEDQFLHWRQDMEKKQEKQGI